MRYVIFMVLLLNISPVQALTWAQVWESLSETSHSYHPRIRNKVVYCIKHIKYETYIAGDAYSRGYVRHHHEKYKVPCR